MSVFCILYLLRRLYLVLYFQHSKHFTLHVYTLYTIELYQNGLKCGIFNKACKFCVGLCKQQTTLFHSLEIWVKCQNTVKKKSETSSHSILRYAIFAYLLAEESNYTSTAK